MITGEHYIEVVSNYFNFLISEFDFKIVEKKVRGNAFYDLQYKDRTRVVSISYENIEDYLLVIIFMLENGNLPDYDDKTKTLHLNILNRIILSKIDESEIEINNKYFSKFEALDKFEYKLLKSAKELRLCLKHFDKIR